MQEFVSGHITLPGCVLDLAEYPKALAFCKVSPNARGYQDNKHGIQGSDHASYLDKKIDLHNRNDQKQRKEFKKHDGQFQGSLSDCKILWFTVQTINLTFFGNKESIVLIYCFFGTLF